MSLLSSPRFLPLLPLLLLLSPPAIAEEPADPVNATFDAASGTLVIPKLGIPSGDAGYAYRVEMALVQSDPIAFGVRSVSAPQAVTAEEALSALYHSEQRTLGFGRVDILHADGTTTSLPSATLTLGSGDPFAWFYLPAAE